MTPEEKLTQIVKAADYVVAIAKQERYKNIRLDSMKKALDNWDQVRKNCSNQLTTNEGKNTMNEDIVVRLQKNVEKCDDEMCAYCPVDNEAINEIQRLRALVDDLRPFMEDDVRCALDMGHFTKDHPEDDCNDCKWYARALEWQQRINDGELNV